MFRIVKIVSPVLCKNILQRSAHQENAIVMFVHAKNLQTDSGTYDNIC